ncbi:MAG: class I SAM-dependent methyltransferase [Odoribacteraceae bacterium]|jgi:16S rRNA G966 N2-methylase RsmD|nr:class I SAM-dependent methyltransferase [Odoribacteraceae bacterium]
MQLTPELIEFIRSHEQDATDRLLLSASKYPGVEMPFVVEQIIARQAAREKLPTWHAERRVVYPSRLAVEQASSEITARYKQRLLVGETACDLTGGLGSDAYYLSRAAREMIYVERDPACCRAARDNFEVLNVANARVLREDAGNVAGTVAVDTFYIDPSRRTKENKRVFTLADCEPDALQLKPLLLERARRVIVKCSPMLDIVETLHFFPECEEVHVLAVKNECKELLLILGKEYRPGQAILHAVNITAGAEQRLSFTRQEEQEAVPEQATVVRAFLYEPNSALLKAGAFKTVATRFRVEKLHPRGNLYTSDNLITDFPGRIFAADEVVDFSGKALKLLAARYPKANITARNFTLPVAALREKSGIKEGGDVHLFATTLAGRGGVLLLCHKVV